MGAVGQFPECSQSSGEVFLLVAAGSPLRLDRMLGGPPAPPPAPPPPPAPRRRRRRSLTPPPLLPLIDLAMPAYDEDDVHDPPSDSDLENCPHDAVPSAYSSVSTYLQSELVCHGKVCNRGFGQLHLSPAAFVTSLAYVTA